MRLIATYDVFESSNPNEYAKNIDGLIATYDVFEFFRCFEQHRRTRWLIATYDVFEYQFPLLYGLDIND